MIGVPFNSYGDDENTEVIAFSFRARRGTPLSGYLAGKPRGGDQVVLLEDAWSQVFNVKHSIAVNSATSGLLAAAFASDLKAGDTFLVPTMTMSATAAAPCFTGATPRFLDVESATFASYPHFPVSAAAVFVTNLFGHPAPLHDWRKACDAAGAVMIEDNAQSPFATAQGKYAGTIGHIGVFSLNIHKPIQCGEGGMIVTNDDGLAEAMRDFINHGEHSAVVAGKLGLNLRMPEICAVVALTQLQRAPGIIGRRIEQAEAIINAIGFIPGLRAPITRAGCKHVYYTIPFLIDRARGAFCDCLTMDGIPNCGRYAAPLHMMPAFGKYRTSGDYPVADKLWLSSLFYIENSAWTFTKRQIKQIGEAFHRAADTVKL